MWATRSLPSESSAKASCLNFRQMEPIAAAFAPSILLRDFRSEYCKDCSVPFARASHWARRYRGGSGRKTRVLNQGLSGARGLSASGSNGRHGEAPSQAGEKGKRAPASSAFPPGADVTEFRQSIETDPVPDEFIKVAVRAADAAREVIRPLFRSQDLSVDAKDDASPVTVADREAERAMREVISAALPGHMILGEEEGGDFINAGKAEWIWVLDPIDGTKAFISGKPTFGTLIAILRRGVPMFGIIDQPITEERWMGGPGRPTTFNGSPARVKKIPTAETLEDEENLLSSVVVHSTHPDMFMGLTQVQFRRLEAKVKQVMYGSDCYAYALLASGHLDLVVEADLKVWDFAALAPVVVGAGGYISDFSGRDLDMYSDGRVVASPELSLHVAVLRTLGAVERSSLPSDDDDDDEGDDRDDGNGGSGGGDRELEQIPTREPAVVPGLVESMTGFGAAESLANGYSVFAQVRSVNSRYCEVQVRGPKLLNQLESEIIAQTKRVLNRGKVVVTISVSVPSADAKDESLAGDQMEQAEGATVTNNHTGKRIPLDVDVNAAKHARRLLDDLAAVTGVRSEPTLSDILYFSDVFMKQDMSDDAAHLLPAVRAAATDALARAKAARRLEGAILEQDMQKRCTEISRVLDGIEKRAPERVARERDRLKQQVADAVGSPANVDTERLEQEIALMADRIDITEEIVRLRAHVSLFQLTLGGIDEPIGQRLGFLLQEMHREATTISSKANDASVAHLSVLIKQEVEKIREQVQNIC